jgi:hypothetical protein
MPENASPIQTYQERLARFRSLSTDLLASDLRVSNIRLVAFLATLVVAGFAVARADVDGVWVLFPFALFAGLAVFHGRMRQNLKRAQSLSAHYQDRLDRIAGQSPRGGAPIPQGHSPDHLFAADLDLFGDHSIFARIDGTATETGKRTLANWLAQPATPAVILERQEAVRALIPRLDLRERAALTAAEAAAVLEETTFFTWIKNEGKAPARVLRIASWATSLMSVTTGIGWALGITGLWPFGLSAALQLALALSQRSQVQDVLRAVDRVERELRAVASMLALLEESEFKDGPLGKLRNRLVEQGHSPAKEVKRLRLLVDLLQSASNQLFAPVAALVMWRTQVAWALLAWRARVGPQVAGWWSAVGEFEALLSLAAYAFERPEDVFPSPAAQDGPFFEAEELGHPLLEGNGTRNSLALSGAHQLLLLSGSNMSGKSTLLRAAGVAVALAQCGAPVCARQLTFSPLVLGATLRVQDSLSDGASRFFAEIRRIQSIVNLARDGAPVFFLFDEMLGGTNSHDRRLGATAILKELVELGAIGICTTHDLALTRIVISPTIWRGSDWFLTTCSKRAW